jgi:superfamily I DNA/RNA helicase
MSEFRKFGVAASQEGGNPLTDSAAVELILSALMMSEHPGDKRWSFHTHHSPLAQLPDFGPDLIRDWITDVGIAETIERLADSLAPVCDARDSIRLRQLVQLSISYDTGTAPRVRDFVRMVRQKRVERPQAAQIRVMTVHQSKGLEFDAVILPQLDADLSRASGQCIAQVPRLGDPPAALTRYVGKDFWHFLSADWQQAFRDHAQQSITEAICLLYVAITRARQAVYMLLPPASKAAYEDKQAGALIYHALGAPTEPDQENVILYQSGNPDWVTCR